MIAVVEMAAPVAPLTDPATAVRDAQRARAAVLMQILDVPGLMPVAWSVEPEAEMFGDAGLRGQFDGRMPLWQAHAEVGAYAAALGLKLDKDRTVVPASTSPMWVRVSASGVVGGVTVRVWASAIPEPRSAVAA